MADTDLSSKYDFSDIAHQIGNNLFPDKTTDVKPASSSPYDFSDIAHQIGNNLYPEATPTTTTPAKKKDATKQRGFWAETGSALGSGLAATAEGITATAEMAGFVPGAGTASKFFSDLQETEALARPEYLKDGTVLDKPERLADWRWWVRSLGENLPNMATMMIPGAAAYKGARALAWGAKAQRAAGLAGSFAGSFSLEAGGAYSSAKKEMTATGQFDEATIERIATIEGLTAGTANAIIELLPFNNLFLKQAGADRLLKRIVRQTFLEGGTEAGQEAVNIMVEKFGHKPDQTLIDNIGRIMESGIIGGAMGGIAGGTIGTHEHSQNTKYYNELAKTLQIKEEITGWKAEGLSDKDIAAKVAQAVQAHNDFTVNMNKDLPPEKQAPLVPEIEAAEMTNYVLYADGKIKPDTGIISKTATSAKDSVLRSMGMKSPTAKPAADATPMTTSTIDSKTLAQEDQRQTILDEEKLKENKAKGKSLFDAVASEDMAEQQELELARKQDAANRDAETARIAAAEDQQIQGAIADAQGQQTALKTSLAGDDARKQTVVDDVLNLTEKPLLTAVQKETGMTIVPAGPGLWTIETPAGPQPVNLLQIRQQLAAKRIEIIDKKDAKAQADEEAMRQSAAEAAIRKVKKDAESSLKTARDFLATGSTLSPELRAVLENNRQQLTEKEIKELDKPIATGAVALTTGLGSTGSPTKATGTLSEIANPDYVAPRPHETDQMLLVSSMLSDLDNSSKGGMVHDPITGTSKRQSTGIAWLSAKNLGGINVDRAEARTVLTKVQESETLTPLQQKNFDAITKAAAKLYGNEMDESFAWAQKGFRQVVDKKINVDDLNADDRFVIAGEEFQVTNVDEKGNVTLKDGTIRTVKDGTIINHVDYLKEAYDNTEFNVEEIAPKDETTPKGTERETINKAFGKLIEEIKTKETDKGTAMYSRGENTTGQQLTKAELEQHAKQLMGSGKNQPLLVVVEKASELPFDAPEDAKGAYHNGTLYLVADQIASTEDARVTIAHEIIGHFGLRGFFGSTLDIALLDIHENNPLVRKYAAEWKADNLDFQKQQGMSDVEYYYRSIEEAMAKMAQENKPFTFAKRLLSSIQTLLRQIGLTRLADSLEAKTNAEAMTMLHKANLFIKKGIAKDTSKIPEALYPYFMTAWHGSPHTFDKFSKEKIGTGEGAQVYGYGLYFAGKKEIGEHYRDALQKSRLVLGGVEIPNIGGGHVDIRVLTAEIAKQSDATDTQAHHLALIIERATNKEAALRMLFNKTESFRNAGEIKAAEAARNLQIYLHRLNFEEKKTGRLYKVELAPNEDEYLLWDKPLSEQSEKVKESLKDAFDILANTSKNWHEASVLSRQYEYLLKNNTVGSEIYGALGDLAAGMEEADIENKQKAASEILYRAGIRGNKYLDGTTRSGGTVQWKEGVDQNKYHRLSAGVAENYLESANGNIDSAIKNLKDDAKSSGAQQYSDAAKALENGDLQHIQDYNYVIFDDNDVAITEKYSVKKTAASPLSLETIQKQFSGQQVTENKDGSITIKTEGGKSLTIEKVESIPIDKEVFEKEYGRPYNGESAYGVYIKGQGVIRLAVDKAGNWTLRHEQVHWMIDTGILKGQDIAAIKSRYTKDNPGQKPTEENLADYIANNLQARTEKTGFGKVMQKIADFIDKLVNALGLRTGRGVLRDIESGAIYGQSGETQESISATLQEAGLNPAYGGLVEDTDLRWEDGKVVGVNPEVVAAIQKEIADIVETAKTNGTHMKAPNGETSKLNPEQWAMVRTERFKKWFGDFEAIELRNRIDKIAPISIAVLPEHRGAWKDVADKAVENYKGRDNVVNKETKNPIKIADSGLRKSLQHGTKPEKAAVLSRIDDLLEVAAFVSRDINNLKQGVKAVETYAAPVTIDNAKYIARLVVREVEDGRRFYDHKLSSLESAKPVGLSAGEANAFVANRNPQSSTSFGYKILQAALFVKPENVSKVVDPDTKEPMVVYHGTSANFSEFTKGDLGFHFGNEEQANTRMTYTDNEYLPGTSLAEGANIMPVYLKINNPLHLKDIGDWDSAGEILTELEEAGVRLPNGMTHESVINSIDTDKITEGDAVNMIRTQLQTLGYDGIVYNNEQEGRGESYIVFSPTQIKSTGNVGTFSEKTGDIRYSAPPMKEAVIQGQPMYAVKEQDKIKSEAADFAKQLDDYSKGKIKKDEPLTVGSTPYVLEALGAKQLPIVIDQKTIHKIIEGKHELPLDSLKQITEQINDPIMVFNSATEPDSMVIMTSLVQDGKTIVVALHLEKQRQHHVVNEIASVHPRQSDNHFMNWIETGLLKYMNKKKSREWFLTRGVQFPKVETAIRDFKNKILFDYDLVKRKYSAEDQTKATPQHPEGYLRRLGDVELKDMVNNLATIAKGINVIERDGVLYLKTKSGDEVRIVDAEGIDPNTVSITINKHYAKEKMAGKLIAGMFTPGENKKITLVKDVAGIWTLSHEFYHFLEDIGAISNADKVLLNNKIASLIAKDAETYGYLENRSLPEQRAEWIGRTLTGMFDATTPTGKIIARIKNIIDQIINALGIRTAGGVVRDIKSGVIYKNQKELDSGLRRNDTGEKLSIAEDLTEKVTDAVGKKVARAVEITTGKLSPEKQDFLRTFKKHWDEFWQPFSTLKGGEALKNIRAKAMGDVAKAVRFVEGIRAELDAYPDDVKYDLFHYLNGDIPIESLPEEIEIDIPIEVGPLGRAKQSIKGIIKNADIKPEPSGKTKIVKPREIAKSIQQRSSIIGEMAVDRGFFTQETFDAQDGHYIHWMYAKHIVGDNNPVGITSSGKLDLSWTLGRNPNLTDQQRKELGRIEDASIAVPVGMGKALTDIAKYDYLQTIAENPDWVWQPSVVNVAVGRKMKKAVYGRTRRYMKMGIGKLVDDVKTYAEMMRTRPSPEVAEIHKILSDALDKAKKATENAPADFVQLPNTRGFGPLAGAFVAKPIADDLIPVMDANVDHGKLLNTIISIEKQGMAAFKVGKVALNFPSIFRNTVSNFIQINMHGRSIAKIPGDIIRACESMLAKDKYYEEAFGMGLFNTNWAVSEITDVLETFRQAESGRIDKVLIAISHMAKYYGKIEDITKHTIFLQMRQQEGVAIDKAALEALKWGMDYSLSSRSVKGLRQTIMPFATFSYKIAPLIAESIKKRPWVLAKYALIYPFFKALAMGWNDMDDDDWDDLEKQLPAYIKKSGSMMVLPWKTDKDQWQWVNLEYFFPWGNYLAMFRDAKQMDSGEFLRDVGIGNPFLSMFYTGLSAREDQAPIHSYFGTPIYNQLDPAPMKAAKYLEYMANTWMPSMLTRQGALGYAGKWAMGDEDRWGREVTLGQAAGRWFGLNIVSVSPEQSRAQVSVKVQELHKELARIEADPSRSDEDKAEYKARMNEKIGDMAKEAPSAILPITKAKGHDNVYEALQEMASKGILHTAPPSRSMEINGIPLKMSMDQYKEYLDKSSEVARRKLETLVTSPGWETMPDYRKGVVVEHIVANARKSIRQKIKAEMLRDNRDKIMEERKERREKVS